VSATVWETADAPVAGVARIVIVEAPAFAVAAQVKVKVVVPVPGATKLDLANVALTPVGSPVTDKVTAELSPPTTVVAIDSVPPAERLKVSVGVPIVN
jgi:hypothetical protein